MWKQRPEEHVNLVIALGILHFPPNHIRQPAASPRRQPTGIVIPDQRYRHVRRAESRVGMCPDKVADLDSELTERAQYIRAGPRHTGRDVVGSGWLQGRGAVHEIHIGRPANQAHAVAPVSSAWQAPILTAALHIPARINVRPPEDAVLP